MAQFRRGRADVPGRPDAFDALADPTRRAILEMLRADGNHTAGAIAAAFPAISRPAVSRHLRVLRESGLVSVRKSGRECHYALDERGLMVLYQGWLAQFEPIWDRALRALKRRAESVAADDPPPRRRRRARR